MKITYRYLQEDANSKVDHLPKGQGKGKVGRPRKYEESKMKSFRLPLWAIETLESISARLQDESGKPSSKTEALLYALERFERRKKT